MQKLQKFILVFIILGTVLVFNPLLTTEIFEWPKLMLLLISVAVFSLVNIVDWVFGHSGRAVIPSERSEPRDPSGNTKLVLFFVLLFLIGNIIAFIYSTDRATSLLGNPIRFQGFLTQLYYVLFGINVWYFLSHPKVDFNNVIKSIFRWLIILLVVVCLLAMAPFVFPDTFYFFTPKLFFDRVFGTLGNPNYLAVVIIVLFPFFLFTWKSGMVSSRPSRVIRGEGRGPFALRLLHWPVVLLVVTTLFYTGSRGAWLTTIVGLTFYGIVEIIKRRKYKLLFVTLGVVVLVGLGIVLKDRLTTVAPQFERLTLDTPTSNSIGSRLIFWRVGLKMALARPLTGFGQDMVAVNIEQHLPEYLKSNDIFYVDRIHSEFIDILVMQGGFSFVGYVGLLAVVWFGAAKKFWRNKEALDDNLFLGTALLAVFILTMFHAINFSTISSNVLLVFLLGHLLIAGRGSLKSV